MEAWRQFELLTDGSLVRAVLTAGSLVRVVLTAGVLPMCVACVCGVMNLMPS